jgi:hypothetical protein
LSTASLQPQIAATAFVENRAALRYARFMDRDTRAFVERDWGVFERLRFAERAARYRKEGAAGTVKRSRALWHRMRSMRRGWPTRTARAQDLAHHVELKRTLDRAAGGFTIR